MGQTQYTAQRPKMAVQHQDRFWMSNCFDDLSLFPMNLDMGPVLLENLSPYLSKESMNAPIGFRMGPRYQF
jgi:hypothetical protein